MSLNKPLHCISGQLIKNDFLNLLFSSEGMSIDGVKGSGFIVKPFVLNPPGAKGTYVIYI